MKKRINRGCEWESPIYRQIEAENQKKNIKPKLVKDYKSQAARWRNESRHNDGEEKHYRDEEKMTHV